MARTISFWILYVEQWRRQLYGALGHVPPPPRLPRVSFLVHFGVNMTANYPSIVRTVICQQLTAVSINADC